MSISDLNEYLPIHYSCHWKIEWQNGATRGRLACESTTIRIARGRLRYLCFRWLNCLRIKTIQPREGRSIFWIFFGFFLCKPWQIKDDYVYGLGICL